MFLQAEGLEVYMVTPCYCSLYTTPSEHGDQVYVILAVRCEEEDACKLAVTMETSCLTDSMTVRV